MWLARCSPLKSVTSVMASFKKFSSHTMLYSGNISHLDVQCSLALCARVLWVVFKDLGLSRRCILSPPLLVLHAHGKPERPGLTCFFPSRLFCPSETEGASPSADWGWSGEWGTSCCNEKTLLGSWDLLLVQSLPLKMPTVKPFTLLYLWHERVGLMDL